MTGFVPHPETVFQRADEAHIGNVGPQFFLHLADQCLRAGLPEFDAAPDWPQVGALTVRIMATHGQNAAFMPEHTDGHRPDDLRCHDVS